MLRTPAPLIGTLGGTSCASMNADTALDVLRRKGMLVAQVRATCDDSTAWIGIYPLDLASEHTREFISNQGLKLFPREGQAFHVRKFEVSAALLLADMYLGEDDLARKESFIEFGEQSLMDRLRELGVAPEDLQYPWKTEYPI